MISAIYKRENSSFSSLSRQFLNDFKGLQTQKKTKKAEIVKSLVKSNT